MAYRCINWSHCLTKVEILWYTIKIFHSTKTFFSVGINKEEWAKNLKSSDFQLLCPNGARAEVTQYADCNWAQVPAHAVMVHPEMNIHALFGLLDKAQVRIISRTIFTYWTITGLIFRTWIMLSPVGTREKHKKESNHTTRNIWFSNAPSRMWGFTHFQGWAWR